MDTHTLGTHESHVSEALLKRRFIVLNYDIRTGLVHRLTLYDMRVVLQKEVVEIFGDKGRHAGIRKS